MYVINMLKTKVNIKAVGALFIVLLVVLMFLSKTIYYHNLSEVTAVSPISGKISKYEIVSGIVDWANIEEMYSEVGGIIEEILVNEGDRVTKGQPLFRLSYDEDEINTKLKEIEINKKKLYADIENLEAKINETKNIISNPALAKDLTKIMNMINKMENQIKVSEEEYAKLEILYENGAIPKMELDNSKNALENLKYDLQGLKNDYEIAYESYKDNLISLEQSLISKKFDVDNLVNQEEIYKKTIFDYKKNTVIAAPKDAVVISIPLKAGQYINQNQLMISFGIGNDFKIVADVPIYNNFIAVGDICYLTNSSHTLEGIVTKVSSEENNKQVTVALKSDDVTMGETFDLEFSKESTTSYTLVPNGAINKDNEGYFIYQIKKRKGILGEEFYVKKAPVYIGDSDDENTVITKGIGFFEPIVLLSDKPLSDGETVKVVNAGDFFAE